MKLGRPESDVLHANAPKHIWAAAIKEAERSPFKRHRTGAVIYVPSTLEIISKGCSYPHDGGYKINSVHAEHHALKGIPKNRRDAGNLACVVVTLTSNGSFARVSKPCSNCARLLLAPVATVTYCEKANDNSWTIMSMDPLHLMNTKNARYRG